jgi:hypothetical protein
LDIVPAWLEVFTRADAWFFDENIRKVKKNDFKGQEDRPYRGVQD